MRTAIGSAARSAEFVCILVIGLAAWASMAAARDYCARDPRIEAVDLSAPVSQSFLDNMRAIGITVGCSATQYCPEAPTTRGQMAVFLIRTFFAP